MGDGDLEKLYLIINTNLTSIDSLRKDLADIKNEWNTQLVNNTCDIAKLSSLVEELVSLTPEVNYNYPKNTAKTYMRDVMKLKDKDIDTLITVMPIALGIDEEDFCIPFAKAYIYSKTRWSE